MPINKIFIIDGSDQLGKSTCIEQLARRCESLGYVVYTMFHKEVRPHSITEFEGDEMFGSLFKQNQKLFDITSAHLHASSFWMKQIFEHSTKPTCIIFDRLHMSSLVFGSTIRKEEFNAIWGDSRIFIDFMNIFERRLDKIATTQMFILVHDKNHVYVDDNENPLIKIHAAEQRLTNQAFIQYFDKSILSNKYLLVCSKDNTGHIDSQEQIDKYISL